MNVMSDSSPPSATPVAPKPPDAGPCHTHNRPAADEAHLSPDAFAEEQAALGRCWTFLGFEHQIPARDDWFTAILGGRSIFVQRFDQAAGFQGLAAFENRCAHRGYPLRTGEAGNGPVLCGFHHWRYNHEGLALGIPHCPEMFGCTPREMNARLERVELAQCGQMIFGRFGAGASSDGPALAAWLGPAFPILAFLTQGITRRTPRFEREVKAHWRVMMEITLDDYHVVAVHPETFGKSGYISNETIHYARFGAHSAYLPGAAPGALEDWAQACAAGSYTPQRYRIVQVFPGLIVSVSKAIDYLGEGYWFLVVQTLTPRAHDRTFSRSYFVPLAPFSPAPPWRSFLRWLAWFTIAPGFRYFARKVHREDNEACENLQRAAIKNAPPPRLARQEERVGWFNEAYARVVRGTTPLP
jgi:phenylpropionate dioxygenase-like ring-hydroxylating dioxygenase large terminal subunit